MRGVVAVCVLAAGLACVAGPALPAAAAVAAARPRVHHWRAPHEYRGISLSGTWTRTADKTVIAGRMRDTRKDGRWVRVTVEGRTRSGRAIGDSFFLLKGGHRAYTSPVFRHRESPSPARAFARACVLRKLRPIKVLGCGHWHRIF